MSLDVCCMLYCNCVVVVVVVVAACGSAPARSSFVLVPARRACGVRPDRPAGTAARQAQASCVACGVSVSLKIVYATNNPAPRILLLLRTLPARHVSRTRTRTPKTRRPALRAGTTTTTPRLCCTPRCSPTTAARVSRPPKHEAAEQGRDLDRKLVRAEGGVEEQQSKEAEDDVAVGRSQGCAERVTHSVLRRRRLRFPPAVGRGPGSGSGGVGDAAHGDGGLTRGTSMRPVARRWRRCRPGAQAPQGSAPPSPQSRALQRAGKSPRRTRALAPRGGRRRGACHPTPQAATWAECT